MDRFFYEERGRMRRREGWGWGNCGLTEVFRISSIINNSHRIKGNRVEIFLVNEHVFVKRFIIKK